MATTQDCAQITLEQTPRYEGAPTTTPYQISTDVHYLPAQSVRFAANPSYLDRSDEIRGIEGAVPRLIETYEPGGALAVRAYVNSMTWLLSAAGLVGTFTAGDGIILDPDAVAIPSGASRWVFNKRSGLTAKTLQLILAYASRGIFVKGQGVGLSSFALTGDGAITADLAGLVFGNVADPNLTPTLQASSIYPLRRGDMTVTWLASSGTTQDFSVTIANPLVRRRTYGLGTPSFYPDVMEQGDDRVMLTGSIPKSMAASADLDALLSGATFTAKARWKTVVNIGATAYKYSVWIEMPKCQYVGGELDELANRRRFGGSFDFFAAWDEGANYDFKATLVNSVASITAGTPALTP